MGGAYPFQPDVFAHQADNINGSFDLRLEIQFSNNSASPELAFGADWRMLGSGYSVIEEGLCHSAWVAAPM